MSIKTKIRGAQAPLIGSKISLKIEKLAVGGAGIARYEGLVVFVPDSAPSDEVLAEVVVVKKNFVEARIVEIFKSGPARRAPPCKLAGRCGGCNWQHITESEQLNQKSKIVYETLTKFNPEIKFEYLPITPSPRALRYRNRIQPKYKNGHFGFYERNSHKIVDVEDCLICETSLVEKFQEAKNWVSRQDSKGLQRLEIALNEDHSVQYRLINQESDSEGFSQVNRFQNEDLIQTALAWAGQGPYKNIFDLYYFL
jgi:23S rRNA (uracil1939-C5)-methyltransferase